MKTISYLSLLGVSIVAATLVSACKDDDVEIQGRAMKGVLRNAVVTAYKIVDGQVSAKSLRATRTDARGDFELKLSSLPVEPIAIVVTTDAETRVVCDNVAGCTNNASGVAFGDEYPPSADLRLRAFIPALLSGDNRVNITPVSEMVAAKASATGYIDQSAILGAHNEWNVALHDFPSLDGSTSGADILTTRPIDISKVDEANRSSDAGIVMGFLCASATRKAEKESGGDLVEAIAALDSGFASGSNSTQKFNLVAQMGGLVMDYLAAHSGADTPITRLFAVPFPAPPSDPAPAPGGGGGGMGGGGAGAGGAGSGGGGAGGGGGGGGM